MSGGGGLCREKGLSSYALGLWLILTITSFFLCHSPSFFVCGGLHEKIPLS